MKTDILFETFSIITKEEKVSSLNHHVMRNTLVLEIVSPLPGYYGAEYLINREQPGDLLLITKNYVHFEDFFRINKKIHRYLDFDFDSTFARVNVSNKDLFAIRIKGLQSYEELLEVQKAFYDEGIAMEKHHKINEMGIIRVKKFLKLEMDGQGIIRDLNNPHLYYFEIPEPVGWKMFEKISKRIRHNTPGVKFDAALGVLFRTGDLMDVVRIYSTNLSEKKLLTLKEQYLRILSEYR